METTVIRNESELYHLYHLLKEKGEWIAPRGLKSLEIQNFTYSLGPYVRFNNFQGRNFNLKYLKREIAWYIKADPTDLSIAEHAAQWGKIVANGKLNSNYGAYWFGKYGVCNIVRILEDDPMSRRAVIPMYGTDVDHMDIEAKDVPCTIAMEFRIRDNRLNCRAIMRSQDILWGMANDIPTFSILQEIIAALLDVQLGVLTISVGSFHVYESRFEMFKEIIRENKHIPIVDVPRIPKAEAHCLSNKYISPDYAFSRWLLDV